MKSLQYTGEDGINWNIEIHYVNTFTPDDEGLEQIIIKSDSFGLSFRYGQIPIGTKFNIEPSILSNGVTTYGCLKYDDKLVCSFDPNI